MVPALLLFFLSPLVGEWLLGNQKVTDIYLLPVLALLYGCGAILIREVTRRKLRGYPTMLGLGVAYALFEEGVVDQLLFNSSYFIGQRELSTTLLPVLGIDAWLTLLLIGMHALWSTFIPIVLVEMIFTERGRQPWLGDTGFWAVSVLFVIGSAVLGYMNYESKEFFAPLPQLLLICTITASIAIVALRIEKIPLPALPVALPGRPWMVGVLTFIVSSLYMHTGDLPGWLRVASCLLLAGGVILIIHGWSRNSWDDRHTLAAIAGGLLTYWWLGVLMTPESGPKSFVDHAGSFALIAVVLGLIWLARRSLVAAGNQKQN